MAKRLEIELAEDILAALGMDEELRKRVTSVSLVMEAGHRPMLDVSFVVIDDAIPVLTEVLAHYTLERTD